MEKSKFDFNDIENQVKFERLSKEDVQKIFDEGGFASEGEIKKTEQELEFIKELNKYLNNEFKRLGILDFINEERRECYADEYGETHYKTPKTLIPLYKIQLVEKISKMGVSGHCDDSGEIVIDAEKARSSFHKFCDIATHEILHSLSYIRYNSRFGYRTGISDIEEKKKIVRQKYSYDYSEHFMGLTEAITEKMTIEILNNISKQSKFPLKKEQSELLGHYSELIEVLNIIIEKVAKENDQNKNEIWENFKIGLFTGEMMYLRKVEKIFGKGSLRILAALQGKDSWFDEEGWRDEELCQKAIKYFQADNKQERDKIALGIFRKKFLTKNNDL